MIKNKVFCIMQVYNEEEQLPSFFKHIEKYVDGFIILDDSSTDKTFQIISSQDKVIKIIKGTKNKNDERWKERANRQRLIETAQECGADWVLCVDADERFQSIFLKKLKNIVNSPIYQNRLIGVHFRELWDKCNYYRIDGIWNVKQKFILFPISKKMTFNWPNEYHQPWFYNEIKDQQILLNYNLYHLKMILDDEREKRKELYNSLDPQKKMQPIGYDYLCDTKDLVTKRISFMKRYNYKYIPSRFLQK